MIFEYSSGCILFGTFVAENGREAIMWIWMPRWFMEWCNQMVSSTNLIISVISTNEWKTEGETFASDFEIDMTSQIACSQHVMCCQYKSMCWTLMQNIKTSWYAKGKFLAPTRPKKKIESKNHIDNIKPFSVVDYRQIHFKVIRIWAELYLYVEVNCIKLISMTQRMMLGHNRFRLITTSTIIYILPKIRKWALFLSY